VQRLLGARFRLPESAGADRGRTPWAEQQDASNRAGQVEQGLLAPVDVVQTQTADGYFPAKTCLRHRQAITAAENVR